MCLVKSQLFGDINIRHAVAVSETKRFVVINVVGYALEPPPVIVSAPYPPGSLSMAPL